MASDSASTLDTSDAHRKYSKTTSESQTIIVTATFVEPSTAISHLFPANKQVRTTIRDISGKLVGHLNKKDGYNLRLKGRRDIQYHGSYPLTGTPPKPVGRTSLTFILVHENATTELAELDTRHLELVFKPRTIEKYPSKPIYARNQSKNKRIMDLEERGGKYMDRFEQLEERLKMLERKLERQERKYEKQKRESREELEKYKRESWGELEKYKRESRREFQEVCHYHFPATSTWFSPFSLLQLKDIVLPLHVCSILDQCRKRVMERMQFTTGRWETFRGARNEDELVSYITQAVHLSSSAAHLLCGKYGCYLGDFAAHSCSENQARRAVLAKENAHFRGDLGELFTFVYGSAP